MHIGVPREIKNHEYRVGLTPSSVREMVAHGHQVTVETGAGKGIGATDEVYQKAGAVIAATAAEIFATAEMIVKVKEPQAGERAMLREGQILYTYLHLAPDPAQCADLVSSGAVCIAYETVTQAGGGLPLLAPMSEVAGRLSVQAGAYCLEKAHGGMGMSCSAASPAFLRRRSSFSAAASSARTPRRSLLAAVPRWWSSTATSTSCGAWIVCSARA
jgi:alanine dehydrogenase